MAKIHGIIKRVTPYLTEGLNKEIPEKWKNYWERSNYNPYLANFIPKIHRRHKGWFFSYEDCWFQWNKNKEKFGPEENEWIETTSSGDNGLKFCPCVNIMLNNTPISTDEVFDFLYYLGLKQNFNLKIFEGLPRAFDVPVKVPEIRETFVAITFHNNEIYSAPYKRRKREIGSCSYSVIPYENGKKEIQIYVALYRWSVMVFLHEFSHAVNSIAWAKNNPGEYRHPISHGPSFNHTLEIMIETYFGWRKNAIY